MVYLAQIELDFCHVGFTKEGGKESKHIEKIMVPSLVCRYQTIIHLGRPWIRTFFQSAS